MNADIVPLSSIAPDERNANKGTERGRYALERSLEKLGAGRSILLDKNGKIIAGNKTAETAGEMGIEDVVIVRTTGDKLVAVMREDLDLDEPNGLARQMAYSDNRVGQLDLDFDPAVITFDLEAGLDLSDFWNQEELTLLTAGLDGVGVGETADAEPQTSRAEELREEWGTQLGQLWKLPSRTAGQCHYLICGDCTDKATVERVMMGERARIGFTSPPYLDMREYSGNDLTLDTLLGFVPPMSDTCDYSVVNLGLKFEDGEVVRYWDRYLDAFARSGEKLLAWNVWDKTQAGSIAHATNMFFLVHEWIFVFGDKRAKLNRTVANNMAEYKKRHGDNVLKDGSKKRVRQADGGMEPTTSDAYTHHQLHSVVQQTPELGPIRGDHPATFPVGLPTKYIEAMTKTADLVYEPFNGSGSTLLAAENLSRQCRAIEISPAYVAVALQRYADAFGGEPELIQ